MKEIKEFENFKFIDKDGNEQIVHIWGGGKREMLIIFGEHKEK